MPLRHADTIIIIIILFTLFTMFLMPDVARLFRADTRQIYATRVLFTPMPRCRYAESLLFSFIYSLSPRRDAMRPFYDRDYTLLRAHVALSSSAYMS